MSTADGLTDIIYKENDVDRIGVQLFQYNSINSTTYPMNLTGMEIVLNINTVGGTNPITLNCNLGYSDNLTGIEYSASQGWVTVLITKDDSPTIGSYIGEFVITDENDDSVRTPSPNQAGNVQLSIKIYPKV